MSSMSKAVWSSCASGSLAACEVGVSWDGGGKGEGMSTVAACGCFDRPLARSSCLPAAGVGYEQVAFKRRQASLAFCIRVRRSRHRVAFKWYVGVQRRQQYDECYTVLRAAKTTRVFKLLLPLRFVDEEYLIGTGRFVMYGRP
jgi:hypothetical protein